MNETNPCKGTTYTSQVKFILCRYSMQSLIMSLVSYNYVFIALQMAGILTGHVCYDSMIKTIVVRSKNSYLRKKCKMLPVINYSYTLIISRKILGKSKPNFLYPIK